MLFVLSSQVKIYEDINEDKFLTFNGIFYIEFMNYISKLWVSLHNNYWLIFLY